MCGLDTTIKGRFRRAWMRCARRMGRRERVKFAEERRADWERGGRPWLEEITLAWAQELGLHGSENNPLTAQDLRG